MEPLPIDACAMLGACETEAQRAASVLRCMLSAMCGAAQQCRTVLRMHVGCATCVASLTAPRTHMHARERAYMCKHAHACTCCAALRCRWPCCPTCCVALHAAPGAPAVVAPMAHARTRTHACTRARAHARTHAHTHARTHARTPHRRRRTCTPCAGRGPPRVPAGDAGDPGCIHSLSLRNHPWDPWRRKRVATGCSLPFARLGAVPHHHRHPQARGRAQVGGGLLLDLRRTGGGQVRAVRWGGGVCSCSSGVGRSGSREESSGVEDANRVLGGPCCRWF
jgi:hypothetical protein